MARSLKEQYTQRKLQQLQERARQADQQLLAEANFTRLLVEAMDEEDLQKVSAIVDKLNTLKTPELPHLSAAIEQAQAELNKFTAGGPIAKAWGKLKSKVGIDNPVVKVTTFADALERGFSQIPTILKNNGVNLQKVDLNRSLAQALATGKGEMPKTVGQKTGAKSDEEMGKSPVTGKNVPDNEKVNAPNVPHTGYKSDKELGNTSFSGKKVPDKEKIQVPEGQQMNEAPPKAPSGEEKLKTIVAQLRKALSPGGIFGVFKKVPYIDSNALAQELVAAPLKVFSNIAKRVQAGAKASEIAPDMKAQIQGQGGAETKGQETSTPEQPTSQTQPTSPGKPTTSTTGTTGTGQQPGTTPGTKRGGGGEVKAGAAKIVADSGAKDQASAYAVLRHLIKAGLLDKNKLAQHAANGGKAA